MTPSNRNRTATLALIVVVFLLTRSAAATTFVLMSDEDLAHGADVIALGTISAIHNDSGASESVESNVQLRIEQSIKGPSPGEIAFRLPGGWRDGVHRVVFGAPSFYLGERALVFLRQRPDGQLTPVGLAMGKFTILERSGQAVARRQLGGHGTAVLTYDKRSNRLRAAPAADERPLARLLAELRAVVGPQAGGGGMMLPQAPTSPPYKVSDPFTFLGPPNARWREPDQGRAVVYGVVPEGDRALGPVASQKAVQQALAAWSDAGSKLKLADGGPAAPAPYMACDGVNTIQFNDPFNEIGAPTNCGGVLAIGGYCATSSTTSTAQGQTFHAITEGDLTVNDGFAGCGFWTPNNVAEVVTHEIGHTIGLGHSSESWPEQNATLQSATMFFLAHFDGRGAALEADDVAAVQYLYGKVDRLRPRPVRRALPNTRRSIARFATLGGAR